jgi:hypothetical protein
MPSFTKFGRGLTADERLAFDINGCPPPPSPGHGCNCRLMSDVERVRRLPASCCVYELV